MNGRHAGINQYRRTQILTASDVQVIVLLYDGALQSLELAREGILKDNYADKARFLSRAFDIVSELSNVLDMERGGEVAATLRRLYDYMLEELTLANLRHAPKHLDGPIRCLTILREAWQALVQHGALTHAGG
ncbi:MAG TPA: flagellar export chaperone FliS [Nitrospiraceae bacterium]|nr:flagellar export chaperone FliS [Nitrospiraceae bacterium]